MSEKDVSAIPGQDADTISDSLVLVNKNAQPEKPTFLSDLLSNPEIASRMQMVNDAMDEFINSCSGQPATLYDAAKHLLSAGGKRLRSLILLLSTEAVGGDPKKALPFAVAVELIQTASLIHDDIVDDDLLRRGVETTHRKYGARIAVLAGDLLVAQAVKLVGNMANPELVKLLGDAGVRLCEGEASDMFMALTTPEKITTKEYLQMIRQKTAAFMRVAAGIGALIGEGTNKQKKALMDYAEKVGMAFQIRDDILNLTVSPEITGKSMLSDLEWNRSNYVLIHCLETAPESLRLDCLEALENGDMNKVLRIVKENGSVQHANELAQKFAQEAKVSINDSSLKVVHLLENLADFVVTRVQ